MNITINQISSLDKVFKNNKRPCTQVREQKVLKNERFSYQLAITSDERKIADVSVESPIAEYVTVYRERAVICDFPKNIEGDGMDDNYLTDEPDMIPDVLEELNGEDKKIRISPTPYLLWIRVDIPEDAKPGKVDITVEVTDDKENSQKSVMTLEILDITLPKNDLVYTQWFYNDCIASAHGVEIYSERHWELIETYIKNAADMGINMLLSPVHNPPLDTKVGMERPNVQLAVISKSGDNYEFDFSAFERWVGLCKKYGIKYYEMPHFFSQWGMAYAPNIYVNGEHMFGVHMASDSKEYIEFLEQYIPAIISELKTLDIYECAYFHISDEPSEEHIGKYKECRDIIERIAGKLNIIDALSEVEFYQNGLITTPIPASNCIEPFLKEDIKERWVYYCCVQGNKVSNRFIAMSSFRNRIMGVQMYKFGIKGFLQWGYNFYYAQTSIYKINPYLTTSADCAFPSGDAFSVYPGQDGATPSLRALVFYEGLQDMALCKLLEEKTSKEYVVNIIDDLAKKDVRFADMPEDEQYLFELRERIITELQK